MDIKTITVAFVAIMVGAVIFGAMIPIFQEVTDDSGDPITKTNIGTKHTYIDMKDGDVFGLDSVYSDGSKTDTWTYNGEAIVFENVGDLTWDWGMISDKMFVQVNSPNNSSAGRIDPILAEPISPRYIGSSSSYPHFTVEWVYSGGQIVQTINTGGDDEVTTYDNVKWAYCACSLSKGAYMSSLVTTNSYYAKYNDKNVILAGNYTTGDFDTGYYFAKDGALTVLNTSYSGTVNFTQSLTDGTTDIYDTTLSVTITDGNDSESFSPYRALVPYQVTGHASSGSVYTVFGILPLVVAIGLLLGAIGFFVSKRF